MIKYYNKEKAKLFFRFLKNNDMFTRYAFNSTSPKTTKPSWTHGINILTISDCQRWISSCFEWSATKEDHNKWLKLNDEWTEYIRKEKLYLK